MDTFDFEQAGKAVLKIELDAIEQLSRYIDTSFTEACKTILNCEGKVVVMGMGKSGHIGRKIAATFASTGTPAFFVHPGEASHGDLGMIEERDVLLTISNSGEASEILALLPVVKRRGITMISLTGNPDSTLAALAQVHLCIKVPQEACPIGLAPTASTTATLVMGDALAVALMQAKGFTADDFALFHPGGPLGRKLLHISDVMHSGAELPKVRESASITETLLEISQKRLGMTGVVNENDQLIGIFTDGDLRRIIERKVDLYNTSIGEVMGQAPITVHKHMLVAEGLKLMEDRQINGLLVVEDHKLIGALNLYSLVKARVL